MKQNGTVHHGLSFLRVLTSVKTRSVSYVVLVFSFLLFFSSLAHAGRKTGADFLKIPVGAAAVGMGQAYTASARGVNALGWNPAGIAQSPYAASHRAGFSFSHQELLAESRLDHLGMVLPSGAGKGSHAWGVSLLRLSHADQDARSADRTRTGSFNNSDMAVGAALAMDRGHFQWGTQISYIRQELAEFRAQGVSMDLGFLSKTRFSGLSIGGAVRNLGPEMQFIEERFDLPLTLSVGAMFDLVKPLRIGVDLINRPHQSQTSLSLGTEFSALGAVTLRGGYLAKLTEAVSNSQESATNEGNFGGLGGVTAGLGLNLAEFKLDYALSQFGELGVTHTLTLSTWFGGEPSSTGGRPTLMDLPSDDPVIKHVGEPEEEKEDRSRRLIILDTPVVEDAQWW